MGGRRRSRREELGDRLAQARKAADKTQDAIAGAVGVSPRQISRWENGTTVPQKRHGERLAAALNIDYHTLRDLMDAAADEAHDEVVRDRDAAIRERDALFEKVDRLTRVVEALVAQLERQAMNGRR